MFFSHKKTLLFLAMFVFGDIRAQDEIPLYQDSELQGLQAEENVRIAETGDHVVSNIHKPSIIAYLPKDKTLTKAAIIIAPGGGHRELWIDHEGHNPAKWFQERGIAAFVLKYRLSNEEDTNYDLQEHSLRDAQRAIRHVRKNATEYGVDVDKIGIMGFSAGGEIAALTAMRFTTNFENDEQVVSAKPNYQVLVYPGNAKDYEVVDNAPPAFILAGVNDRTDISEEMANLYLKYKKAEVPVELHLFGNAGHGFGLRERNTGGVSKWINRLHDWMIDMNFTTSEIPRLKADLILDTKSELGEGTIWHPKEQKLYWVDIEGHLLHKFDPKTHENVSYDMGSRIGTVVPLGGGGLAVALQDGIYTYDTDTKKITPIIKPYDDKGLRFNDGKCDPSGRFWVGTLAMDSRSKGAKLYKVDEQGKAKEMLDQVSISNGIVWTKDKKTMYYNDTPTGTVQAFDFDNTTGEISNRRDVINFARGQGGPDGMTIDSDDNLWIALWGAGKVVKYNPRTGKLLKIIEVGSANVTSCAFGGENLEVLYISTARAWANPRSLKENPASGGLFSIIPGEKGVEATFYNYKKQ